MNKSLKLLISLWCGTPDLDFLKLSSEVSRGIAVSSSSISRVWKGSTSAARQCGWPQSRDDCGQGFQRIKQQGRLAVSPPCMKGCVCNIRKGPFASIGSWGSPSAGGSLQAFRCIRSEVPERSCSATSRLFFCSIVEKRCRVNLHQSLCRSCCDSPQSTSGIANETRHPRVLCWQRVLEAPTRCHPLLQKGRGGVLWEQAQVEKNLQDAVRLFKMQDEQTVQAHIVALYSDDGTPLLEISCMTNPFSCTMLESVKASCVEWWAGPVSIDAIHVGIHTGSRIPT